MKNRSPLRRYGAALVTTLVLGSVTFSGQAAAAANGALEEARDLSILASVATTVQRRQVIGTWRIRKKNGEWMVLSFNRNGGFALVHSKNPKYIIAGKWRLNGNHIRTIFLKVCNFKGKCKTLPRSARQVVTVRVDGVHGRTLRTSEGIMRPARS